MSGLDQGRLTRGHVVVVGPGAPAVVSALAEHLGFEPVLERDDAAANPYLEPFYRDMRRHASMMQARALTHGLRRHKDIARRIRSGASPGVVEEGTVWDLPALARMLHAHPDGLLSDLDYTTIMELFGTVVAGELPFPELLVLLRADPETAAGRLRRGPRLERDIDLDYLRDLQEAREDLLAELEAEGASVLPLDWGPGVPAGDVAGLVRRRWLRAWRVHRARDG